MLKTRPFLIFFFILLFLSACAFKWSDERDWEQQEAGTDRRSQTEEPVKREKTESVRARDPLSEWIGKSEHDVIKQFGQPDDVGLSAYDYEWLIYNRSSSQYVQFGREDNEIVTVFAFGENLNVKPFAIGQSYDELKETVNLMNQVSVTYQEGDYRFELTEEDLVDRPLIKLRDNLFAQLYFDRYTAQLVSIRYLDGKTLLKQRPYRMVYIGNLIETRALDRAGQHRVDESNEKQIFYITNVLRERYGETSLQWNDQVADVAYYHSKEMKEKNYFDHVSPLSGTLENRLQTESITYVEAGENIAAEYPDGISATMGWLNSEGHRHILLHETFTDLGVGVYEKYYTQNFISKEK